MIDSEDLDHSSCCFPRRPDISSIVKQLSRSYSTDAIDSANPLYASEENLDKSLGYDDGKIAKNELSSNKNESFKEPDLISSHRRDSLSKPLEEAAIHPNYATRSMSMKEPMPEHITPLVDQRVEDLPKYDDSDSIQQLIDDSIQDLLEANDSSSPPSSLPHISSAIKETTCEKSEEVKPITEDIINENDPKAHKWKDNYVRSKEVETFLNINEESNTPSTSQLSNNDKTCEDEPTESSSNPWLLPIIGAVALFAVVAIGAKVTHKI